MENVLKGKVGGGGKEGRGKGVVSVPFVENWDPHLHRLFVRTLKGLSYWNFAEFKPLRVIFPFPFLYGKPLTRMLCS